MKNNPIVVRIYIIEREFFVLSPSLVEETGSL